MKAAQYTKDFSTRVLIKEPLALGEGSLRWYKQAKGRGPFNATFDGFPQ